MVAGVGRRSREHGCLDVGIWVEFLDAVEQRKKLLEMRR